MGRLRSVLTLLLVVLVTTWSDGLCRPAVAAPAQAEAPCHGASHGDRDAGDRGTREHGTPAPPARSCSVCPLCVPVAPLVKAADRLEGPLLVLSADLPRPVDRPGPRPLVPPPKVVV